MTRSLRDFEGQLRHTLRQRAEGLSPTHSTNGVGSRRTVSSTETAVAAPWSRRNPLLGRAAVILLLVAALGAGLWLAPRDTPVEVVSTDGSPVGTGLDAPDAVPGSPTNALEWEPLPLPPLAPLGSWAWAARRGIVLVHGGTPLDSVGADDPGGADPIPQTGSGDAVRAMALSTGAYFSVENGEWRTISKSPVGLRGHFIVSDDQEFRLLGGNTLATGVALFDQSLTWSPTEDAWSWGLAPPEVSGAAELGDGGFALLTEGHLEFSTGSGLVPVDGRVDTISSGHGLVIGWTASAARNIYLLNQATPEWVSLPAVSAELADLTDLVIEVGEVNVYFTGTTGEGEFIAGAFDPIEDSLTSWVAVGRGWPGPVQLAAISDDALVMMSGGTGGVVLDGTSLSMLPGSIPPLPLGSRLVESASGDAIYVLGWNSSGDAAESVFGRLVMSDK